MVIQLKNSQSISRQERLKKIPLDFAVETIKNINENPELGDEPLYDLTKENICKLRELINIPFTSFGGFEKYSTLEEKAAVIFCATIRDHKFGNGNKRTAVILLLSVLYVNEKWTTLSENMLYKLAMEIAKDTHTDYETQVRAVAKILSNKIITLIEA